MPASDTADIEKDPETRNGPPEGFMSMRHRADIPISPSWVQLKITRWVDWAMLRSLVAYSWAPLTGLLTAPILARSLGPEGRGQLAAIMQPLTIAEGIAIFGLPAAVSFYVSRNGNANVIVRRGVFLSFLPTAIVGVFLLFYSSIIAAKQGLPQWEVLICWLVLLPVAYMDVRRAGWAGLGNWNLLDRERTVLAVLRAFIIIVLGLIGISQAFSFAFGQLLFGVASSAVLLIPYWKSSKSEIRNVPSYKSLVYYSSFSGIGAIALAANARLDQALLPALTSGHELGLYAIAVTVAEVPAIARTVTSRNLLRSASIGDSPQKILRTLVTGVILTFTGCSVIAVSASTFTPIVFGKDFSSSIFPMQILLVGTVLGVILDGGTAILNGIKRPGLAVLPAATSSISMCLIFAILGHRISAVIAAIVSSGTQMIGTIIVVMSLLWAVKYQHRKPQSTPPIES